MPKTRFTTDLPPELYVWIEEYRKKNDISRNQAIAEAVELLQKKQKRP
jgi:metal-responsive CopG/Arc/MetJ family transcriptional regulator